MPEQTDLLKLLSLAGGVSNNADTSKIMVRKSQPALWRNQEGRGVYLRGSSYRVDLESALSSGEVMHLSLNANDFVFVPKSEPLISDDIFRSASVVSLVVGSILTAVLINDRYNRYR